MGYAAMLPVMLLAHFVQDSSHCNGCDPPPAAPPAACWLAWPLPPATPQLYQVPGSLTVLQCLPFFLYHTLPLLTPPAARWQLQPAALHGRGCVAWQLRIADLKNAEHALPSNSSRPCDACNARVVSQRRILEVFEKGRFSALFTRLKIAITYYCQYNTIFVDHTTSDL